jgi:hypothetical protein
MALFVLAFLCRECPLLKIKGLTKFSIKISWKIIIGKYEKGKEQKGFVYGL